MREEIRIAVALITRENGDTLLVRKRGGIQFMQAGGRIKDGEVPKTTLGRRLHEELGILVPPSRMAAFGCFEAEAADETDQLLVAYVFRVQLEDEVITPTSEIDEARWIPLHDAPTLPLAPLTRNHILTLFWQMQFGADLPHQRGREAAA